MQMTRGSAFEQSTHTESKPATSQALSYSQHSQPWEDNQKLANRGENIQHTS